MASTTETILESDKSIIVRGIFYHPQLSSWNNVTYYSTSFEPILLESLLGNFGY